ncbi:MFS transporter [Streptomyces sp. NPDC004539]|uniref:MFS transporter n=1 Tax=Streptomyces sp. NPDC004539 TaxID=3154280 RepID=UPI00339EA78D
MTRRYGLVRYLFGAGAARTGDEMSGPALLLTATAITGTASSGAALLSAVTASAALGGPVLGVLLDHARHPGRLLAGALAAYAGALALVCWTLGELPLPAVLFLSLTGGLFAPALASGWTSQLPHLTDPGHLPRAGALDAASYEFAALAGPALAGGVALAAGPQAALLTSVALIVPALPAAWTLPGRADRAPRTSLNSAAAVPPPSVLADLRAGLTTLLRTRPLARATLASTLSHAGLGAFTAGTPYLGARAFGDQSAGAFLLAALALTSLAASLVLARRPVPARPDTVLLAGTVLLGAAFLVAAVEPLAGALLAGLGAGPQLVALFAIRHREAPERLRGQILSTGASLKISGYAAGAGTAALCPPQATPLVATACQVLAVIAFLTLTRSADRPETRPESCG